MSRALSLLAVFAALSCGCAVVQSTIRYGTDGQPEYFIDCSGKPMTRCYDRALALCPAGYFLRGESQVPGGAKSGGVFGRTSHVGAEGRDTRFTWKNQLVVRCKQPSDATAQQAPAETR